MGNIEYCIRTLKRKWKLHKCCVAAGCIGPHFYYMLWWNMMRSLWWQCIQIALGVHGLGMFFWGKFTATVSLGARDEFPSCPHFVHQLPNTGRMGSDHLNLSIAKLCQNPMIYKKSGKSWTDSIHKFMVLAHQKKHPKNDIIIAHLRSIGFLAVRVIAAMLETLSQKMMTRNYFILTWLLTYVRLFSLRHYLRSILACTLPFTLTFSMLVHMFDILWQMYCRTFDILTFWHLLGHMYLTYIPKSTLTFDVCFLIFAQWGGLSTHNPMGQLAGLVWDQGAASEDGETGRDGEGKGRKFEERGYMTFKLSTNSRILVPVYYW